MISNWFLNNPRLTLLVICLITVSGLSSYVLLPRMEDPKLVDRAAFINTVFPGADPSRVESLVTEKIEDELHEIDEIKEIRSSSMEGFSAISIELRDDIYDAEEVWSKLRDRLDDVSNDFPEGAFKPEYVEIDFKAFALLAAITWEKDTAPNYAVLKRWAKQLEEKLRSVSGTEKIKRFGEPDEEILVVLNVQETSAMGLSAADVSGQIRSSDAKTSAGLIRGNQSDFLIEVSGELESLERIEQIPIYYGNNGLFTRLGDIAEVKKTIARPQVNVSIVSGKPAVTIGAYVRPSVRIDHWAAAAHQALTEFEAILPSGVALDVVYDQNRYVESRLSTLVTNLMIGGAAVFVVIFILMGWRNAIVVSLALPLASMMVLTGMRLQGIPIHQMSITGLIIALGLLIDNAIVVVDEVSSKLRAGMSASDAVNQSVGHLFLPLVGSTLTTAFAFGPIALMPGPAGEFVGAIAINVIVAIFSSLFLAMTIVPAVAAMVNRTNVSTEQHRSWLQDGIHFEVVSRTYSRFLNFVFAKPWIGVAIGASIPIVGFIQSVNLEEQFFPPADRDQLHIEIELGPQASVAGTRHVITSIRDTLLNKTNVLRVDCFIGSSAPSFYYNLIARKRNVSQYAQAIVQLDSAKNIAGIIHEFQNELDRKFPQARVLVRQLEQGPPFDAPVEVRIFGPDLLVLKELGAQVRQVLVETPGIIHTRSELDEVLPKVELAVSEENARSAGLELSAIAEQVNAWTEGTIGGSIVEATEELPVRVRLNDDERESMQSLGSLDLVSPTSVASAIDNYNGVPLTALADIKLTADFGSIPHLAGRRMNEIQCYIPAGVLPSEVLSRFEQNLKQADVPIPDGYKILFGGEAAKRDEAIGNLMANVGVLLVLMIATLVLSFGSFRLASMIGVVGALSVGLGMGSLWLYGYPFGFMAIVGTMGLIGVAINDSIVVLAAIRSNDQAKGGDHKAIIDAVGASTRHIISTSLTTMAGFAPLVFGGGGFWPPLAIAIAGGVGGATILALVFVPSAYLILIGLKSAKPATELSIDSVTRLALTDHL